MKEIIEEIIGIPPAELGKGSPIKVEIVDTEDDVYHDFARAQMTPFILPGGPVGQYRRLACCSTLIPANSSDRWSSTLKSMSPDSPISTDPR